ncbi:MAG TPA: DUF1015 domain-containing protein, partial [Lacipirellulaceae bacterium]|nr:DUF1015 domain-containing protein [Lacipirellulaceae bacterium]
THGAAKADRLKLWSACKANLSQIFGLYPDPTNNAQSILESAITGVAPLEATDHLGVVHRVWPVTDVATITAVIGALGERPVYIADGHHRYETAIAFRDRLAAELAPRGPNPGAKSLPPEHPANYVLMMLVSMNDPGMLVLATHRLFRGLPPITSSELRDRLGNSFTTEPAGTSPERARSLWEEIELEGNQSTLGLYTAADDAWTIIRLAEAGRQRMAEVAGEHSKEWQGLGVSILHRLVIDTLLCKSPETRSDNPDRLPAHHPPLLAPKYVRDIEEVVRGLKEGDTAGRDATGQTGTAGQFELAALVMPATVDHIRAISSHGERMPAKSTYFYPKLLSGLVINPLE